MESSPPHHIGPGERLLAAIVFTDVVSFSARMQTEEVTTLGLLERDFAEMRKTCEKFSGEVLKTTGDGLLLYFTSAVNAVACAQKIQRTFAERARTEAAEAALTHRVGIHLGDVFVKNDDVMGDGVNIAARLQSQAEPGGICISQTVYDVVKNKLELEVVKLEPRELKNISDPMPMYRILLEPAKPRAPRLRPPPSPLLQAPPPPAAFSRNQKLGVLTALVLALAAALFLLVNASFKHEEELAQSQATQAALDAAVLKKKSEGPGSAGPTTIAVAQPAEDNFVELLRSQVAGTAREDGPARQRAAALIPGLLAWMTTSMQRYTQDRPLLVHPVGSSAPGEMQVFTDAEHRLYFAEGGAIRQRNWSDLKPGVLGAIVVSALQDSPAAPPREVARAADAFAYYHGLPEVAAALHRNQR